ncbi:hypothetical protein BHE74_00016712 [Ensete ventricosum]|nr:hypothetical protein BHE74_00016712 [Ensete ventricosum]
MNGGQDMLIFVLSLCFLSMLEMKHRQPLFTGDVHEPHGHGDDHGRARSQGNTSHGASRIRRSAEQHKAKMRAAPPSLPPTRHWYAKPNRVHGRTDQDLLQAARDVGAGRVRFISSRRIALVLRLIYALATEGAFFLSRLGKAEDKAITRYDLGKESKYCCRHSLWG